MEQLKVNVNRNEIENCSIDKKQFNHSYNSERYQLGSEIYNICHYIPYSIGSFMNNLDLYSSDDSLIDYLKLDYYEFIRIICKSLDINIDNIDINAENEDDIINIINDKIYILKYMDDLDNFKNNFPTLYKYYSNTNSPGSRYKKAQIEKDFAYNNKYNNDYNDLIIQYELNKGFRSKLFGNSFVANNMLVKFVKGASFCECQADSFKRLINHKEDIRKLLDNHIIDKNLLASYKMDNEKMMLYILDKYLDKAITLSGKNKLDFMDFVDKKLDDIKNPGSYLIYNNNMITFDSLINKYDKLFNNIKEPRIVFLDEDIVTKGKINNYKYKNLENNVKELSIDEKKYLINYNKELIDFYENSGYIGKLVVKNGIEGDVGFVYPNGEIIVDYISPNSEDSNLKKLHNRGIYHLDIHNFDKFKGTERLKLRKLLKEEKPYSKNFTTHKGNWEERVLSMINETSENDFNEALTDLFIDNIAVNNKKNNRIR